MSYGDNNAASRARGYDTVLLKGVVDFFSVVTNYVSQVVRMATGEGPKCRQTRQQEDFTDLLRRKAFRQVLVQVWVAEA